MNEERPLMTKWRDISTTPQIPVRVVKYSAGGYHIKMWWSTSDNVNWQPLPEPPKREEEG
jgi:hypothetical protein